MVDENLLDKLDTAFIFLLGITNIFFSIIQIFKQGIIGLIEISPILILGILLPFYIGYIRGAISINDLSERVRGWVYLFVSTIFYISLLYQNFILYFALVLLTYFIIDRFYKWINFVFSFNENVRNDYIYYWTIISAIALGFSSRILIMFLSEFLDTYNINSNHIPIFSMIFYSMCIFFIIEKLLKEVKKRTIKIDNNLLTNLRESHILIKLFNYGMAFLSVLYYFKLKGKVLITLIFSLFFIGFYVRSVGLYIIGDIFIITSNLFLILGTFWFVKTENVMIPNPGEFFVERVKRVSIDDNKIKKTLKLSLREKIFFIIIFFILLSPFVYTQVNATLFGSMEITKIARNLYVTDPVQTLHNIANWEKEFFIYDTSDVYFYPFFPFLMTRKNSPEPEWVIITKRGGCGEHAILFTALAKEAGINCRIVHNSAEDHAWSEVFINGSWKHFDPMLSKDQRFDNPSFYEKSREEGGWGKKLSYVYYINENGTKIDVTNRYTETVNLIVKITNYGKPILNSKVTLKSRFLMENYERYKNPIYCKNNITDVNGTCSFEIGDNTYTMIIEFDNIFKYKKELILQISEKNTKLVVDLKKLVIPFYQN